MAIPSIKATYSLDVESVRMIESLARKWRVSKSEVMRRAVRIAASGDYREKDSALEVLDRLQSSVRERKIDLSNWASDVRAERLESERRRGSGG